MVSHCHFLCFLYDLKQKIVRKPETPHCNITHIMTGVSGDITAGDVLVIVQLGVSSGISAVRCFWCYPSSMFQVLSQQ